MRIPKIRPVAPVAVPRQKRPVLRLPSQPNEVEGMTRAVKTSSDSDISGSDDSISESSVPLNLAARIKIARQTSAHLNDATDRLNERLSEVEAALVDLQLGVKGFVRMSLEDTGYDETRHLAFRKHEGQWCLVVDDESADPLDFSTTPILKASRAVRIEAADLLPALVDNLIERTATQADEVEKRVQSLAGLSAELREAKS